MRLVVLFLALIGITSCQTGIHLFYSENGMMVQELEKARLEQVDFQDDSQLVK